MKTDAHKRLRTVRAVEQAFAVGRYVYFRALLPWTGGWVRIGNKGRSYIAGLLSMGELRTRHQ